jgi:hypothetical protein
MVRNLRLRGKNSFCRKSVELPLFTFLAVLFIMQEARAAVHRARRTEEEVAECTFAPQVSPRAPSYVERLARGHAARAAAGLSASAESGPEFSWR